jgi:hypothetical protein
MNYRHGTCRSCNAQYKIPASFQADRAKCKECGGVVEIGRASGGGAAGRPARQAQPPPRAAPSRPQQPARPPAPPPRPAAPAPAPRAASPRPAASQPDSARVAAAAAAAAERIRTAAPQTSASAELQAASAATRAKRDQRQSAAAKKSAAPKLALVAVLLIAAAGAGWYFTRDSAESTQAAETSSTEASAPENASSESGAAGQDVDLTTLAEQPKLAETSPEGWAAIQGWVAALVDPEASADGDGARSKLLERGRESFPAILNAFKRLDFATDDGLRAGELYQSLLAEICNGTSFGWKHGTAAGDVIHNKQVVRRWIEAWERARVSPEAWAELTTPVPEQQPDGL